MTRYIIENKDGKYAQSFLGAPGWNFVDKAEDAHDFGSEKSAIEFADYWVPITGEPLIVVIYNPENQPDPSTFNKGD